MYLAPRATCYDRYRGYYYCSSSWTSWVRWLVFGLLIGGAILLFVLFSCFSARRRRRRGFVPYRGTGWAYGTPAGHNAPTYTGGQQQEQQQPYYASHNAGNNYGGNPNDPTQQPYSQPPAYGNNAPAGANQSYYGNSGVTEPSATYGGYKAPEGPPPGR